MKPRHQPNGGGSEDIMAGIEQTRAHMDDTLDELSERLRPRHLLDDLLDYWHSRRQSARGSGAGKQRMKRAAGQVKDSAGIAGRTVVDQVRQHPIPAMLIGAGIAWLLTERNQEEYEVEVYEEDYSGDTEFEHAGLAGIQSGPGPETYALPSHYEEEEHGSAGFMGKMKEKGANLKGKAGESWQRAKERSAQRTEALRRRAGERSARLREQARHGYEAGVDRFKQTADAYPLAVGAGFLALGVLAGMMIPSTRREDEWIGPTRDRVVNRSREAAQEAMERGKHVAQAAVESAKAQAREQGLTPEELKRKASHVLESAQVTAREEGMTPAAMKQKAQTAASNVKEQTTADAKQQASEMKSQV